MGKIRDPLRVKLITGLISNDTELLSGIKPRLERSFRNTVDLESPVMDFNMTDYYKEEMGPQLKRKFYSFKRLASLEGLYKAKIRSNMLEVKLAAGPRRIVNIDPGYIDLAKLVLFSTKDYSHRIYAGKGIYAEVTLHYKGGSFCGWPWTYPDYRSSAYLDFLHKVREIYKEQIK